jgi:hypothetical protein
MEILFVKVAVVSGSAAHQDALLPPACDSSGALSAGKNLRSNNIVELDPQRVWR